MMKTTTRMLPLLTLICIVGCSSSGTESVHETVSVVTLSALADDDIENVLETEQTLNEIGNTAETNPVLTAQTDSVVEEQFAFPDYYYINRNNYHAHLLQAFEVYFGTAYDKRLPTENMRVLSQSAMITHTTDLIGGSSFGIRTCSNGGTVEISGSYFQTFTSTNYLAENCQYKDEVIAGNFHLEGFHSTSHSLIELTDFRIDFGVDNFLNVNGDYRRYTAQGDGFGGRIDDHSERFSSRNLNYDITYLDNSLSIKNANTEAWYGYNDLTSARPSGGIWQYEAYVDGSFTMATRTSLGSDISVSTPVVFEQRFSIETLSNNPSTPPQQIPPLPRFTTGSMLLVAEDNSSIELEVLNEDPNMAIVTIINADEEENILIEWSSLDAALALRDKELKFPSSN